MAQPLVCIGSYTPATGGRGSGITVCARNPETGVLTQLGEPTATPSPSFLAAHPSGRTVYAVNELEPRGSLSSFALGADGSLTPLGSVPSGGSAPCHVAVDPTGRYVLTANYGDGRVSVHPLDAHGAAARHRAVLDLHGDGPDRDRQAGPHAHQVTFDGDTVLVCDLGSDRVWRHRLHADGTLAAEAPAVVPPGFGPRHLARSDPGRVWVVGELTPAVHAFPDGPVVDLATAGPTRNHPSAIVAAPDGRHLYVANRGPDTVTVLSVADGTAHVLAETPSGVTWPRDAALIGDHLYIAGERSDTVTALRRDPATGLLATPVEVLRTGSPTCVVAVPGT
ncbi:lactonase family protein [Yinghuangia sp. YIM S09857]|uniref:lactonase family protein n=1 Tax=Yinghuangia sp. YIM S09857 TaxID=3436929 RepID=UPI003F52CFA6